MVRSKLKKKYLKNMSQENKRKYKTKNWEASKIRIKKT